MTQSVLGGAAANITTAQNWTGLQGLNTPETSYERPQVVAVAGTFSNLRVYLPTAPGAGKSVTFTLRKNNANTAITVTIADAAFVGVDDVHSVVFAAGDKVTMGTTTAGTPALSTPKWSIEFDGSGNSLIMGSPNNGETTNFYLPLLCGTSWSNNPEANCYCVIPTAGKLKKLYAVTTGGNALGAISFTVRKNGASTSLSAPIPNGVNNGSDLVNEVSVVAGDLVDMLVAVPGGQWYLSWGLIFEPTNAGETILAMNSPHYNPSHDYVHQVTAMHQTTWSNLLSETAKYMVTRNITVGKLYASVATAPGAGLGFVFTIRKNSAATALYALILNTATQAVSVGKITLSDGDYINLHFAIQGAPTISYANWSLVKDPVGVGGSGNKGMVIG